MMKSSVAVDVGTMIQVAINSLRTPLTDWISPSQQSWFWYMDPRTSSLFQNPSHDTWLSPQPCSLPIPNTRCRTRSESKPRYSKASLTPTPTPVEQYLLPVSLHLSQDSDSTCPNTGNTPRYTHPEVLRPSVTPL
jgi:hypothetical protein